VFFKRCEQRDISEDYKNAGLDLDKAINTGTKDAIAFDMRGYCRYENKTFDEAIKDFDEAVTKDPKLAQAFYHRGDAKFSVNNWRAQSRITRKQLTLGLTDPVLYNNRGKAYLKQETTLRHC
jgi:tetratricopeptide (TPR) repeat protein